MRKNSKLLPRLPPPSRLPTGELRLVVLALGLLLFTALAAPASAQEPAARRLLEEAEQQLAAGAAAAARGSLELLLGQFPADEVVPAAGLRLAEAYRDLGNVEAARQAVERLVSEHPRRPATARAMVLGAELALDAARDPADLRAARVALRRVPLIFGREAFPDLEARREALVRSGEISLWLAEPGAAADDFLAALENEAPSPVAARARLGLARAWLASGDWQMAAHELERLLAADEMPAAARGAARRQLSLLHRRRIRFLAGQPQWSTGGRFQTSGLDLRQLSGVGAAAEILLVDEKLPLIARLGTDGRALQQVALGDVSGPGFLSDGRPFVVADGAVMLPFDATSWAFSEPEGGGAVRRLVAAARGALGDWYLLEKSGRGLIHVDRGGRTQRLLSDRNNLVDLAAGPSGRIYVLDGRANQVLRLELDGSLGSVALSGSWRRPVALAVDGLGNLYVLDRGERRVELYTPDGRRLADVGPALAGIDLRNPVDLAVDDSGRLYIADTRLPFLVMLD